MSQSQDVDTPKPRLNAAGAFISPAQAHKAEIIERISKGDPLTRIAADLGYSTHASITERLGSDPDYQKAMRAGLIGKIEKREGELETADSNVSVTRADRLLGHARWMAERLDPARFAAKQDQSQAPIQVVVQVFDRQEEKNVIDVQPVDK